VPATTVSGTADEVRAQIESLGAQGVTEVVYQPCGPDIRRELEAMHRAITG
jgi:5,10-methylenetetrahydromethanopterin reductase